MTNDMLDFMLRIYHTDIRRRLPRKLMYHIDGTLRTYSKKDDSCKLALESAKVYANSTLNARRLKFGSSGYTSFKTTARDVDSMGDVNPHVEHIPCKGRRGN